MHLVAKTVKGCEYFYLVEKARRGRQVITVRQIYIGSRQKLADLAAGSAAAMLPATFRPQSVGGALALATLAKDLGIEEIIDAVCPVRAGVPSVGRRLVVSAIHRALARKSSNGLSQLQDFYADSVLPELLPVPEGALDGRRLGAMFKGLKARDVERIEEGIVERVVEREKISLRALAFDCTNFDSYAGARTRSRLLQRGHQKSGKPLRVLGMGLLANDEDIPLLTFTYPGNLNDVTAFKRFLRALDRRCASLKVSLDATVAADGANISKQILLRLEDGEHGYIMRLPPKHLGSDGRLPTAQLLPLGGRLKGKVWAHKEVRDVYGVLRCVVDVYSKRMHQRQLPGLARDRLKARGDLDHLQKQLEKQRLGTRHAKPLTVSAVRRRSKTALAREHMAKLFDASVTQGPDGIPVLVFSENEVAWQHLVTHVLGRTLLVTNRGDWTPEQIVLGSRVQSRNENIFRDLKDPEGVSMLPLRHRKDGTLRAHSLRVMIGLMLARVLQRRVRVAGPKASNLKEVLQALKDVSRARVTMPEGAPAALKALAANTWVPSEQTPRQAELLRALNMADRPELGTTLTKALSPEKRPNRRKSAA
jgi:transposase